jgi:AAHS family 4-hydroxybenzoate transporter-like MFS transporter
MKAAAVLDLQQAIDGQAFNKYHLRVLLLCALSVLMDGFDAQAMGFVAPTLSAEWHISRGALGPILTAGLVGMLCGALFFGPLADRFGRRTIILFCTVWFGVFSLLTASATSMRSMEVLRLLTGFGLGGTLPNAIALTSEYMPKRLRSTCVMLMFTGFSIGAATGGFAASILIKTFGWRAVFVVGGAAPCLLAALLLGLPESIRFLVLSGRTAQVKAYLRKVAPDLDVPEDVCFDIPERRERGFVVGQLFRNGRAATTLLLWVIFFMSLLDLYFLNSWLPTVLHDSGLQLETALRMTAMFQLGGAIGAFVLGRTFDRMKSFIGLAAAYAGAAACVFFIGMAGSSLIVQTGLVFATGVCAVGGQTGANALAAELYPTRIRSTGVGWSLGIGRIGSIVGPMLGAKLLSSHLEVRQVFWAAAVPPSIAIIAAMLVNRRAMNFKLVKTIDQ